MSRASVTRLDIAQNFITKHPPEVYLNHLGLLRNATRLEQPSGLYYNIKNGQLVFYDKNKEQRNSREAIPELYEGKNVLRYEYRFTSRIASQFKCREVTAGMLYDEAFYIELLNRWREAYKSIQKINDVSLNFQAMKTKQQLYEMGVLCLVEQMGGELQMIGQINEAQQKGKLTKKQAYDLRKKINDVCKSCNGLTVQNEAIHELDKKVNEAVKFYR